MNLYIFLEIRKLLTALKYRESRLEDWNVAHIHYILKITGINVHFYQRKSHQLKRQENTTQVYRLVLDLHECRWEQCRLVTSLKKIYNYTHRVVAQITSFSFRKSGALGQRINVTGTGFSTNVSNFTCTVAGESCKVIAASPTQITIEIPPHSSNNTSFGKMPKSPNDGSTQQGAYLGSNGYHYRRYTRDNMAMPL